MTARVRIIGAGFLALLLFGFQNCTSSLHSHVFDVAATSSPTPAPPPLPPPGPGHAADIREFGAKPDGIQISTIVAISAGSAQLVVSGANFTQSDTGKLIAVPEAGLPACAPGSNPCGPDHAQTLLAHIQSVEDATHITLDKNAGSAVNATENIRYGSDNTAAVQAALDAGSIYVPNSMFIVADDIHIPAERSLEISAGGYLVNMGGRFTSLTANHISWKIDGVVQSLGLREEHHILALGTEQSTERGFIEFSGKPNSLGTVDLADGFTITGTGTVAGDWKGTPNFTNWNWQIDRKGIAAWYAKNVSVTGIEVTGFDGEAVYMSADTRFSAGENSFRNLRVHDTRFNALNFNVAGSNTLSGGTYLIADNTVSHAFTGIEMDVGTASGNHISHTIFSGILFGFGAGYGPMTVESNSVEYVGTSNGTCESASSYSNCGNAYWLELSSETTFPQVNLNVRVVNNTASHTARSGFVLANFRAGSSYTLTGNSVKSYGESAPAFAVDLRNVLNGSVSNNSIQSPGPFALGPGL